MINDIPYSIGIEGIILLVWALTNILTNLLVLLAMTQRNKLILLPAMIVSFLDVPGAIALIGLHIFGVAQLVK